MDAVCNECGVGIDSVGGVFTWKGEIVCGACYHAKQTQEKAEIPGMHSGQRQRQLPIVSADFVPQFQGLDFVVMLLVIAGIIGMVSGFIGIAVGVQAQNMYGAALGSAGMSLGFLQLAAAAALGCIRHMAINSFHIRNALLKEKVLTDGSAER